MQRFFDKINKTDNCWLWTAAMRGGYGVIKIKGKGVSAHRLSYEIHKGPIENGLLVCHKCDNRKCVNPDHLFLGTQSDNMIDCSKKGRLVYPDNEKFHYKKGHYPSNTKISKDLAIKVKEAVTNKNGKTLKEISVLFNVPYQYVRDISCGRILKNF